MRADILVGTPCLDPTTCTPSSDVAPFGSDFVSQFQQIYNASLFNGPIEISGLQFYIDNTVGLPNVVDPGSYSVLLETTANTIANAGDQSGTLFAQGSDTTLGMIQMLGGAEVLTIPGSPFFYDPGTGNLALSVQFTPPPNPPNTFPCCFTLALQTNTTGLLSSDIFDNNGTNLGVNQSGLVTGFQQPVPEPSSLWLLASLLIAILIAIAAGLRKKLRAGHHY